MGVSTQSHKIDMVCETVSSPLCQTIMKRLDPEIEA